MDEDSFAKLCQIIWPHLPTNEFQNKNYAGFKQFCKFQAASIASRPNSFGAISGKDIISVIQHLAIEPDALTSRKSALTILKRLNLFRNPVLDDIVSNCVDVALRMVLTLDIQSSFGKNGLKRSPSPTSVQWDDTSSLAQSIRSFFTDHGSVTTDMKTGRIDPAMSMAYLCNERGVRVLWTSNLAEHLSVDWKSRIVTVYEHKIFLWNHLRNPTHSIIPSFILEEAIDSLNVLFPLADTPTKDLLEWNEKVFYGLGYCSRPRDESLDLGRFNFWRDRMAKLMEIMNEEPRGLKQLALEKSGRNLLPFLTFWVATAVGILTILSLPFSVVSMLYGIKQYELALAQACSASDAHISLPKYCR